MNAATIWSIIALAPELGISIKSASCIGKSILASGSNKEILVISRFRISAPVPWTTWLTDHLSSRASSGPF
jgi:hypothetical protein